MSVSASRLAALARDAHQAPFGSVGLERRGAPNEISRPRPRGHAHVDALQPLAGAGVAASVAWSVATAGALHTSAGVLPVELQIAAVRTLAVPTIACAWGDDGLDSAVATWSGVMPRSVPMS